ncbi:MAG: transcription antitermination factor NusB [Cryomorphaceae bacterium]|nr:transcription antitermination factor NusB [Cryomorphaceae bacterium]
MLTRRQLRIKAMQAFYAHHLTGGSMQKALNALEDSLEQVFKLFLLEMKALSEFHRFEEERFERGKKKKMPNPEDLVPNTKFLDNPLMAKIRQDTKLNQLFEEHTVRWGDDRDALQAIYKRFIESELYQTYMDSDSKDEEAHREFVIQLYTVFFAHNNDVHAMYEERNMHWTDDLEAAQMMVYHCLKNSTLAGESGLDVPNLFKDQDDEDFTLELLRKCIQNEEYFEELIVNQTKNWEADRIAVIDKLLMKLALAELIYFSQIPIKVTFNEYIELTKLFSTTRSGNFINGVLDKLVEQLKESKQIRKIGRGLI